MFKLALLLMLVACSSVDTKKMEAELTGFQLPAKPGKGEGVIYVVRPSIYAARVRFYIYLDDTKDTSEMGWNYSGQYVYFYATPGEHTIHSVSENFEDITVTVKEGEATFVRQEPARSMNYVRNYIEELDPVEGAYYVMKLGRGQINKMRKEEKSANLTSF